jgi:anti-sigma B factor antagonist
MGYIFSSTSISTRLETGVLPSLSEKAGMGLQIKQRERETVVILDLKGRLVLGDEDISLLQRLLFLLDSRHRKVILNVLEVSDIDSSGLDTLVFCSTRFQDIGGRLVLLNTGQPGAKVPDILKRSACVEIYREETDAVKSFFPDRFVPRYDILEFVKEQRQIRNRNSEALS